MKPGAWGVLLLTLLVATGCDLDYGKDAATSSDQVPQLVFQGIHQTSVKDGRVLYTIDAEQSEVYQAKRQVRLKQFRFQEYDSEGRPASQGSADTAVVNSDTNDARLSGKLSARSEEQSVTLEVGGTSGGLTWNNAEKILKTEPNTAIVLKKDDGSRITAQALTLDMGANRLELEDGIEGTWTPSTTQDANTASVPPSPSSPPPTAPAPAQR